MRQILSLSQWETRVSDMYSLARLSRVTNRELIEMRQKRIYDELNRKHGGIRAVYSAYVHGYVAGLMRAADADLYRNHLEYCYRDDTGCLYSTHRESVHNLTEEFYNRGEGHLLGGMESGHFWRGTDKPYFVGRAGDAPASDER